MAFTEDLGAFIDAADFAVTATYDGNTPVNVIFDAAYVDTFGIAGTNPVALCAAGDIAPAGIGKTLVVNSVTYKIRNRQPQEDGALVLLQLEKQ